MCACRESVLLILVVLKFEDPLLVFTDLKLKSPGARCMLNNTKMVFCSIFVQ